MLVRGSVLKQPAPPPPTPSTPRPHPPPPPPPHPPNQHEVAAAHPAGHRVVDALAERCGDGSVHRVAALPQHSGACGDREHGPAQARGVKVGAGSRPSSSPAATCLPTLPPALHPPAPTNVAAPPMVGRHHAAGRGHGARAPAVIKVGLEVAGDAACAHACVHVQNGLLVVRGSGQNAALQAPPQLFAPPPTPTTRPPSDPPTLGRHGVARLRQPRAAADLQLCAVPPPGVGPQGHQHEDQHPCTA